MEQDRFIQMTQSPLKGLILRMAVPSMASMLVTAIYNMVDTYFVGFIGTSATGAVGVVFSLMAIIMATGLFFGQGSGNAISRALGEQRQEEASHLLSTGFFCCFGVGVVIAVVGLIFMEDLAWFLGGTQETMPYIMDYIPYIIWGMGTYFFSSFLQTFIRNDGAPKLAMAGVISGGVTNVILDYVFIFPLGQGMAGAALATVMGTCLTVLILCTHFFSKENHLKLAGGFSLKRAFAVASNGLASFILEMSGGFVTFIFNRQLLAYVGETGVVVYSIISNAALVVKSISNGIAQAAQPLISTNYGAGEHGRVGEARSLGIRISLFAGVLFTAIGLLFPVPLSYLFLDPSDEVLSMAVPAIRLYFIAFIPAAWNIMCGTYFQAVVKPQLALANTLLRGIILNSLFVFLLPVFFGVEGIWVTVAVSEALTAAVVFWLMKKETN